MGWMSLPSTNYDYYVDPVSGSDSNTGRTWTQAYATLSKAASNTGTYGRVWLAPGDHTVASEIAYQNKRIQWIGPPVPASQFESSTGGARVTGTANSLSYFFSGQPPSGSNIFGGGFHNLVFDMNAITTGNQALWMRQTNYLRVEGCKAIAPTGTHKNVYLLTMDEVPTANSPDKSWLTCVDIEAYNCGLIEGPSAAGGFNGWSLRGLRGDSDATGGATMPYVKTNDKLQGCAISGGFFAHTGSSVAAIDIDETGVTNSRTVSIVGVAFENLASPYYGVSLKNCIAFVAFPGGASDSDGLIYGDSSTTGYMAVPSTALAGSLVPGVN